MSNGAMIRSKYVFTRKPHTCFLCKKVFEKGAKMYHYVQRQNKEMPYIVGGHLTYTKIVLESCYICERCSDRFIKDGFLPEM